MLTNPEVGEPEGSTGLPTKVESGRVTGSGELKRSALSGRQMLIVAIAATGPMAGIALNLGPMASFAGETFILSFVFSLVGIFLLSLCFQQFARHYPSSGGLYAWSVQAFGKSAGFVYGWLFVGSYFVFAAAGFAVLGGWSNEYIQSLFGVGIPWWVFSGLGLAYTVLFAYFGIKRSANASFVLLAVEIIVALAFAAFVFIYPSHAVERFTMKPFLPSSALGGWSVVGLAMTYSVLSSVGFETASTLGEEATDTRRTVGRSMVGAGLITQVFFIITAYAILIGYANNAKFSKDPAPLLTLATQHGKTWTTFVVLAALASMIAFSQMAFNAGTRVMYSLGREGVLPHALGRTHAKHKTPYVAIFVMALLCMALAVPLALAVGAFYVWYYIGFLVGIAFLVLYGVVALGLIRTSFRDKKAFPKVHPIRHVVIPILTAVFMFYPLYRTVVPLPTGVYRTLPLYLIGWIVVGVIFLSYLKRKRPDAIERVGSLMAGGSPIAVEDEAKI
jgi:amino acid transporter